MLRNTTFNKIFHRSQIENLKKEALMNETLVVNKPELLQKIKGLQSLQECLELHKKAYSLGFTRMGLQPNPYEYFRTESIMEMKPEEVFLGDVCGLFTHTISFWEERKDEKYGVYDFGYTPETRVYDIIVNQYKSRLYNAISAMATRAASRLEELRIQGF